MSQKKVRVPTTIISALQQFNGLTCKVFGSDVPMEMILKDQESEEPDFDATEYRQIVDVRWLSGIQVRLYGASRGTMNGSRYFHLIGARIRMRCMDVNADDFYSDFVRSASERISLQADCYGRTKSGHAVGCYSDRVHQLVLGAILKRWVHDDGPNEGEWVDKELWIASQSSGTHVSEASAYIPACWEGKLPEELIKCTKLDARCMFLRDMIS